MVYKNHIKVNAVGILGSGGGDEIWTCGLTYSDPLGTHPQLTPTQAEMDTLAAHVAAEWQNLLVATDVHFTNSVGLAGARAYLIGTNGKSYGPIGYNTQGIIVRGTATGVRAPYQNALVVTHDAGQTVRKGRYGRCYLPPLQSSYTQDGFIADDLGPLLAAYKSMETAIGGHVTVDLDLPSAWSLSVESQTQGGMSHRVEVLSIGNVMDTQRRRRNKIVETRISTPAHS